MTNGVLRARGMLLAGAMITGPVCILIGHLLNVSSSEAPARYVRDVSAHHTAFIVGSVVLSAGAFLLISAMVGAMRLAPGRGGPLVTIGAILTCVSAVGLGAGTLMLGVVMGMLTPAHAALAMQVAQVANNSALGDLPFTLAPGVIIGPLLVAIGLYRAKIAHRWLAILLGLAVIPVFLAPGAGMLGALMHLPICVAIAGLGLEVLHTDDLRGRESLSPDRPVNLAQA
jgi:hypothetical protein